MSQNIDDSLWKDKNKDFPALGDTAGLAPRPAPSPAPRHASPSSSTPTER
ncbi:unnamed protein product [Camellia sinensis]